MHITRTLVADKGGHNQRQLLETDLDPTGSPYVLLGEPGSGKSVLARSLEERLGWPLVAAGAFTRQHDLSAFKPPPGKLLVIDALDEVAPQAGGSTLSEVLRKLGVMDRPPFLLSCRAIDWEGSADRHQIKSDYGRDATTLHIEPLTTAEAAQLLAHHAPGVDSEQTLRSLADNGLEDLWGNPLTVRLVAKVSQEEAGLPATKTELFQRACELLLWEDNPAHQASIAARARTDELLDSAGAVCAGLILGSLVGISRRPAQATPAGFAPVGEFVGLPDAPLVAAALSTRLFRDAGENLLAPMHRVIAEFLGARWLARRVSSGLSARRVFTALEFAGGVPTALRGVHAWLANHQPSVANRCIASDPYGVLRYGDPASLAASQAGRLLTALSRLAEEDPWFRQGDWSTAAARGLVRPELKNELLALITGPNRHFHLSTLLLGSIAETAMAGVFHEELLAIARDRDAIFAERRYAVDALAAGGATVDWPSLVAAISDEGGEDSERLALEAAAEGGAQHFNAEALANILLRYLRLTGPSTTDDDDDEDDRYVFGVIDHLTEAIPASRGAEILNEVARLGEPACKEGGYDLRLEFGRLVRRLAAEFIKAGGRPSGAQLWTWLSLAIDESTSADEHNDILRNYGQSNEDVRREAQAAAMADERFGKGAWLSLVRHLPGCKAGLEMKPEDAVHFMRQIREKASLTDRDIDVWDCILRLQPRRDGLPPEVRQEAAHGAATHDALAREWEKFNTPAKMDWMKVDRRRSRHRASLRRRRFEKARAQLRAKHNELVAGEREAIVNPAMAYMGRYSDLNSEASPRARLEEWLGPEIAEAARRGFVNSLTRTDLPSAETLAESHANGRHWYMELAMKAGIAEMVADGKHLGVLPREVLKAALVSWWHRGDLESSRLKVSLGEAIEGALFTSEAAIEDFLRTYVEPYLKANAEHITGLYRTAREGRLRKVAGRLALEWLLAYPSLRLETARELLDLAIDNLLPQTIRPLIRARLRDAAVTGDARDMWFWASFAVDWPTEETAIVARAAADQDFIWVLRRALGQERHGLPARTLLPEQNALIVERFAGAWPYVGMPKGGRSSSAWEASQFIRACINRLANDPSPQAAAAFATLQGLSTSTYAEELLHARANQQRRQRDSLFQAPSLADVRQLLTGGLPGRIDDLRALTLDVLEGLQAVIRASEVSEWKLFWEGDKPKDENSCRDVLVSLGNPRFPPEIQLVPEALMPGSKRADALVTLGQMGLPIEIKGQWHKEVWTACVGQLDALYTPSWRAEGRGIYLVFWFGQITGCNPPRRMGEKAATCSGEMRQQIIASLDPSERDRIDVVVLDVSRPSVA